MPINNCQYTLLVITSSFRDPEKILKTLREADFRAPEQVVLQYAVITQLKKNTVLIEPHQGLRVVLSRQLVALQDLYRNVSVAKQLPF